MRNVPVWNAKRLHAEFDRVKYRKLCGEFLKATFPQGKERTLKPDLWIQ